MLQAKVPELTIFIHGTATVSKLLVKKLIYCKKGLHNVDHLSENSYYQNIAHIFSEQLPEKFNLIDFYTYGWSGALGFSYREKAGHKLAIELSALIELYKRIHSQYPKINIVTFSHGGNVALYLAKFKHLLPQNIKIDLIMIAPPVQATTEEYIDDICFEKVVIIFSDADVMQRMDPQNLYAPKKDKSSFFSRRSLAISKPKCKQARITVNGKPIGHTNLFNSFMCHIPYVLKIMELYNESNILTIDVQDQEFLFFKGYNFMDVMHGKRKTTLLK